MQIPRAGQPAGASPLGAPALEGVRVVDLTRFMAGPF